MLDVQSTDAKAAMLLDLLRPRRIMPVLSIETVDQGLSLVGVLQEAGLGMVEVTLRTEAALATMEAIASRLPEVVLGAGTVRSAKHLGQVKDAGARFAVSPGASEALLEAAADCSLPFMPGVGTASEAMRAAEYGFRVLKLFPAEAIGGVKLLKSLHAPLPDLTFCPTGGVNAANMGSYLSLPNVVAVGGSWMVPEAALKAGDWLEIGRLAKEAVALVNH